MTTVSLANRVKVNTATTGTGTVTLGVATSNAYCTFAEGGITDGQTVRYEINEGTDFEIGTGVYTASGTTMTRATVTLSKISGTAGTSKMSLGGTATVSIVAVKEDFYYQGGTDVAISDGGTGAATAATAWGNLLQAAVQADQETGSSTTVAVVPGVQHFHISAAKCWGSTTGGGTPVLNAPSYNMTSITDTGVGALTVTIATDFSSANWISVGSIQQTSAGDSLIAMFYSKAAGTIIIGCWDDGGSSRDPSVGYNWVFFGDLP